MASCRAPVRDRGAGALACADHLQLAAFRLGLSVRNFSTLPGSTPCAALPVGSVHGRIDRRTPAKRGFPTVRVQFPPSYVDVNREPYELDPGGCSPDGCRVLPIPARCGRLAASAPSCRSLAMGRKSIASGFPDQWRTGDVSLTVSGARFYPIPACVLRAINPMPTATAAGRPVHFFIR